MESNLQHVVKQKAMYICRFVQLFKSFIECVCMYLIVSLALLSDQRFKQFIYERN